MNATVFDPKKHLTGGDQRRLDEAARRSGVNAGDFIEAVLKAAIWRPATPTSKKKGGKR